MRILLVEDDIKIAGFIIICLRFLEYKWHCQRKLAAE
jgi:hypothetical protein